MWLMVGSRGFDGGRRACAGARIKSTRSRPTVAAKRARERERARARGVRARQGVRARALARANQALLTTASSLSLKCPDTSAEPPPPTAFRSGGGRASLLPSPTPAQRQHKKRRRRCSTAAMSCKTAFHWLCYGVRLEVRFFPPTQCTRARTRAALTRSCAPVAAARETRRRADEPNAPLPLNTHRTTSSPTCRRPRPCRAPLQGR